MFLLSYWPEDGQHCEPNMLSETVVYIELSSFND